jgi:hypothetical protein
MTMHMQLCTVAIVAGWGIMVDAQVSYLAFDQMSKELTVTVCRVSLQCLHRPHPHHCHVHSRRNR